MKKIICLILSVVMMFSALSISAFAADVIRYGDVNADGVLDTVSVGLTEEERIAFYRSLSIISESLDAVAKNG